MFIQRPNLYEYNNNPATVDNDGNVSTFNSCKQFSTTTLMKKLIMCTEAQVKTPILIHFN